MRQIGLALLVDRFSKLPLFYRIYPGNQHDSKVFGTIIEEMFGMLAEFNPNKQRLTVVLDKGMNSEDNIAFIDDHQQTHFVTTYSTHFAEEITTTPIEHFSAVNHPANLARSDKNRVLAFRTTGEFWGKKRTVVATFNPLTHRKKALVLDQKLQKIREELLEYRRKHRDKKPHWRDFETIKNRYEKLCLDLHIGTQFYSLEECKEEGEFIFRKNVYAILVQKKRLGRNIIVTDQNGWTTEEIISASLDRSIFESHFRTTKSPMTISANPMFHWTDSKIRCHFLVCVIALTMLRILEMKIEKKMGKHSGLRIIQELRNLHSVFTWKKGQKIPEKQIEEPTQFHLDVLKAFGWEISSSWVLQPTTS